LPKTRVFHLAKELGLESKALIALLGELGVGTVTPASSLDDETVGRAREHVRQHAEAAARRVEAERPTAARPRVAPGAVALAQATTRAAAAAAEASEDFLDDLVQAEQPAAAVAEKPAAATVAKPEAKPRPKRPRPRRRREEEAEVAPEVPEELSEEELGRLREAEREREREAEMVEEEEEELRQLEKDLERLERDEDRRAGAIALEQLTPEEREEERRRASAELVKPIPERAKRPTGERTATAVDVPPVVCVLGHVDHGKTTLLDALRETDVTATESGGITQHIGASEIEVDGRSIVFLDTPGHAAFTAMRARGALVTDIAVLIVAADDGVMPQTVEAINHIRAAEVPIIVAVNKTDVPNANIDRVKQQLAEHGLGPEDWGGDTVVVPVSALRREGLTDLCEMVFLVSEAELGDLWADPEASFAGIVIEAKLDASRGPVATVLIRNGSLKTGDVLICGAAYGRVRGLTDWRGKRLQSMGPGHPVEIVGLSDVPEAGEVAEAASSMKAARQIGVEREDAMRQDRLASSDASTLSELFRQFQEGDRSQLNIVLKADVWGSLQAVRQALYELNEELDEVDVEIVHDAVGDVSESDVLLAKASGAVVLGFHVEADTNAEAVADSEDVELRLYSVIYEALQEMRAIMHGMLEPIFEDVTLGQAEVLDTFRVGRYGTVAGCLVNEGQIEVGADMRLYRDGELIREGRIDSLRHHTEDVESVDAGMECGIATIGFRGWKVGDVIEAHREVEVPRKLPAPTAASRSPAEAGSS
jgi:translation initiation factor IF-2